jgi:hypothetical protein
VGAAVLVQKLPLYYSFETAADGVSRKETASNELVFWLTRASADYHALDCAAAGSSSQHLSAAQFWRVVGNLRRAARGRPTTRIRSIRSRSWFRRAM